MAGSVGSEDGDMGFQIAPMVDVVFVLMLFFMAMAGSQVSELELNISLPSGRPPVVGSDAQPTQPIMVDIAPDGQVQVNGNVYGASTDKELPDLRAFFENVVKSSADPEKDIVIIRPARDTRHERVMEVLSAAASSQIKKLTFQ